MPLKSENLQFGLIVSLKSAKIYCDYQNCNKELAPGSYQILLKN